MSKVTNTSKDGVNPHWVMGGNPGAIEEQEAQGQKELMNSTQLPAKVDEGLKKELEEAGVVFGEPDANDPLFCDATLPPGWKKQATDHSMWSKLVDDQGQERASIFYKAAFYDRDAFMRGA
jgi:hypothetical protein